MKKQTLKIYLLSSMLLVLWVIVFFNNSNATDVPISLTLTAGATTSCTNSTSVTLSSLTWSAIAQSQTWTFGAGTWTCTDMKWTGWSNDYTVVLNTSLTSNGWNSIPNTNVLMSTTITTTAWNLTGTTTIPTLVAISSTQKIYQKVGASNIGTFTATPTVVVNVPAYKQPGIYTGTITVTNAASL